MSAFVSAPPTNKKPSGKLVSVFDNQGKFTYVNDSFCQSCGYERADLLGKNHDFLRHKDMPGVIYDELWQWLNQGYSWRGIIKNRSKDGNCDWLDTFVTPQYEEGDIVGFQCISRVCDAKLVKRADKIYQALNKGDNWVTFEFTRRHKFFLLTLITLIAQGFILYFGNLATSVIAALAAVTPIAIFWQDIFPMAQRARVMQSKFDSVSRYIYCGKGTASVFDFNFEMLKAKIRAILERTSDSAIPLAKVVAQVRKEMMASRNNIEVQKQEMMQVGVAINQMLATSSEIAQNTVATAEDVKATQEQCRQARSDITHTADRMRSLAKGVDEVAASTGSLNHEAKGIEGLMADIQSIANQTNLLALNAAIEAARAGENGRGFAVVAEEVRNLSFRTQDSSKQIQTSLTTMLEMISQWVVSMEQTKGLADSCVEAAEHSDQAIDTVYQKIQHIANLAIQIATATEEQGAVTQDISNNMEAVNQASERNWQQTEVVIEQMVALHQSVEDISNLSATFMPKR